MKTGPAHHNWTGGRTVINTGYVKVKADGHPRADRNGYVLEHILVAEKSLGRYLPEDAEIHHVNEVKSDNSPKNLVICPDHAYHILLHKRANALEECGDPSKRKCMYCQKYDDVPNLTFRTRRVWIHLSCERAYHKERYHRIRKAKAA